MSNEPGESPGGGEGQAADFSLGAALRLTLLAWIACFGVLFLVAGWSSAPVALALATVAGFGGIGTVIARQVPHPADQRIGLRGMEARFVPILVLLVPAVILASELDNLVSLSLPRPEPAPSDAPPTQASNLLVLEAVIAGILLRPIVQEFFFRGVLQQGLVAHYGTRGGVLATALLYAGVQASFVIPAGASYVVSLGLQGIFGGVLLGLVRLASGSLLACIALDITMTGFGALAVARAEDWPIPGFNAPGDTTAPEILVPSLLTVALGIHLALRELRGGEQALPPEPSDRP